MRRGRVRSFAVDLALAAVAVYAANLLTAEALGNGGGGDVRAAAHAVATAHGASVALRRILPAGAFAALVCTAAVYVVGIGLPVFMLGPAVLFVAYAIGLRLTRRIGLLLLALCLSSLLVLLLVGPFFPGWSSFALYATLTSAAWFLGALVRGWQMLAREHAERAAELEQARLELARHAVAVERVRIARELHDVVAHSMSVIAMHAGSARLAVGTDPHSERAALEVIERASRDALAEMRRLVTVLRDAEGDDLSWSPAPSLDGVHDLVARVAQAGVTVDVRTEGNLAGVPAGVSLTAYRVIQEALTNVVRHVGPTRARLAVVADGETLSLSVTNEGTQRGQQRQPATIGGHGSIGMRERVQIYGGTFASGAASTGGWRVEARIPYAGTA